MGAEEKRRRANRPGEEAALFLVPTIYTSIRNNDGCHLTEQQRELLDADTPESLMEPIFNSALRRCRRFPATPALFAVPRPFHSVSLSPPFLSSFAPSFLPSFLPPFCPLRSVFVVVVVVAVPLCTRRARDGRITHESFGPEKLSTALTPPRRQSTNYLLPPRDDDCCVYFPCS